MGGNSLDSSQVESEVEVLGSESIALAVIKDLKLTDDPDFVGTTHGPLMSLIAAIFGANEDDRALSDAERTRIAVGTLRDSLSVRRVGLTYVLEISFQSQDQQKAARIANAVADAYINDELNTRYQAARRASIWLQERIAELRNQSTTAARAVEDYKQKNNIVDTGNHGLLTDLQVQETNSQVIGAAAATAEAKARMDRVEQVLKSPAPGEALGTVSDTLKNEVITRLRQRYLDDSERMAKFSALMGPNHLAVINMKNEMAELQKSIVDELQRIAQGYKSDYEIAKAREDSIRTSLGKQIAEAGASGQAQVDLKELESASQTYHTIFENFLQKYTEAVQQQSFPISDARVITPASRPDHKSYPKTTLIALLGLLVGIGAGLVHAFVLFNFDRAVRRPRDVEERLGIECLGMVPLITSHQPKKTSEEPKLLQTVERLMPVSRRHATPEIKPELTRKVLDDPFSHFSEGLRSIKTALDILALTHPMQCIGTDLCGARRGQEYDCSQSSQSVRRRRPTPTSSDRWRHAQSGLSRRLTADAKSGRLELIAGTVPLEQGSTRPYRRAGSALSRPCCNSGSQTPAISASEHMRAVLAEARKQFNHVIVDLPPLGRFQTRAPYRR